jgi:hypothetical protein
MSAALAPGPAHHLWIIQRQRIGVEQQVEQFQPLLPFDDLLERHVNRVGQRLGAEDLLGGIDFLGVDFERRLALGDGDQAPTI